jgi:dienelactone hydrolase
VETNDQIAAVFRPPGQGAGFVAVAGCWEPSTVPPDTFQFYELTVTFIECPGLRASDVEAVAALIAAGRKQPGVRSDAVALYGMSAGGEAALGVLAARHDIRAAALDSGVGGPEASSINTPV